MPHHEIVNHTTVLPDPELPIARIARVFDAPPSEVVRAHTDAALLERWAGPDPASFVIHRWDARTGGAWRVTDHGRLRYGSFHEVGPDRIVRTVSWVDRPEDVTLEILTFIDLGDGRTRLVTESLSNSFEARDGWLASGHGDRVAAAHERLSALLAGQAANVRA